MALPSGTIEIIKLIARNISIVYFKPLVQSEQRNVLCERFFRVKPGDFFNFFSKTQSIRLFHLFKKSFLRPF